MESILFKRSSKSFTLFSKHIHLSESPILKTRPSIRAPDRGKRPDEWVSGGQRRNGGNDCQGEAGPAAFLGAGALEYSFWVAADTRRGLTRASGWRAACPARPPPPRNGEAANCPVAPKQASGRPANSAPSISVMARVADSSAANWMNLSGEGRGGRQPPRQRLAWKGGGGKAYYGLE